jgi:hypothetical protein
MQFSAQQRDNCKSIRFFDLITYTICAISLKSFRKFQLFNEYNLETLIKLVFPIEERMPSMAINKEHLLFRQDDA